MLYDISYHFSDSLVSNPGVCTIAVTSTFGRSEKIFYRRLSSESLPVATTGALWSRGPTNKALRLRAIQQHASQNWNGTVEIAAAEIFRLVNCYVDATRIFRHYRTAVEFLKMRRGSARGARNQVWIRRYQSQAGCYGTLLFYLLVVKLMMEKFKTT